MGGGFGIFQLAWHDPQLFDVGVVVAGYGMGTLDGPDSGYKAPQPASEKRFKEFLDEACPYLAKVPALVVIHAREDVESSFGDMEAIVERIRQERGNVDFIILPSEKAESDRRSKRARLTNHRYFGWALLDDTSDEVLYNRLWRLSSDVSRGATAESHCYRCR